jgi:hypothetical protein
MSHLICIPRQSLGTSWKILCSLRSFPGSAWERTSVFVHKPNFFQRETILRSLRSFPGSAWECILGGSCHLFMCLGGRSRQGMRSQAEPGNERVYEHMPIFYLDKICFQPFEITQLSGLFLVAQFIFFILFSVYSILNSQSDISLIQNPRPISIS